MPDLWVIYATASSGKRSWELSNPVPVPAKDESIGVTELFPVFSDKQGSTDYKVIGGTAKETFDMAVKFATENSATIIKNNGKMVKVVHQDAKQSN